MLYQIGDFSRITRLSIKTLRYYHEIDLLLPVNIDEETGYRFYDDRCYERAVIINELRSLEFSLKDIKQILKGCADDEELITYMEQHAKVIEANINRYQNISDKIKMQVKNLRKKGDFYMNENEAVIVSKVLPEMLTASIRYTGKYSDTGKYIGKLFKHAARFATGTPFCLYYETEYKDDDNEIAVCVEVKKEFEEKGIDVMKLEGGKAISLIHAGSYETLGSSYKKITDYANANNLKTKLPTREIYLKGPGMIFRGNPEKYVTEIQFLVD
jgi:DNA-binding transcriptional MerR regulator